MLDLKRFIADKILCLVNEIEPDICFQDILSNVAYPKNQSMGDYAFPCFKYGKLFKKSPQLIADDLAEKLKNKLDSDLDFSSKISKIVSVSGFLNFFVNPVFIAQDTIVDVLEEKENFGKVLDGNGKKVIVEYSSANIAKPFHIGHLRSTMIGESLKRLFDFYGYKTVAINHIGDYGTQFGKLIVAINKWGNIKTIEKDPINSLVELYIRFHKEAEQDHSLEDQARANFVALENGDEDAFKLWKFIVDISLSEFNRVYKKLGVKFDSYNGESFYSNKMKPILEELRKKNLIKRSEGAEIVDLEDVGLIPALVTKKDGSTLYLTRDLAAARYRKSHYDFYKNIYVVGSEQKLHFEQIFAVLKKLGDTWVDDCIHVKFGMVSLEIGKLSTREGNIVKLENVLEESVKEIRGIIEQKNSGLENIEKVSQQIGYGAVIFQELYTSREKDYAFSVSKVTNYQGETGPYAQYTHARCCSLIAKEDESLAGIMPDYSILSDESSQDIIKILRRLTEVVGLAIQNFEPHTVARYVIDLAQAFNRFYHENPIHTEDPIVTKTRLELVKAVKIVLKTALGLVCLEAPEEM